MTNKQTSCQVFLVIKRRFIQRPKVTESKKKTVYANQMQL